MRYSGRDKLKRLMGVPTQSIKRAREEEERITKRIFASKWGTPERQEKRQAMVRKRQATQKINPDVIVKMHNQGLSNRAIARDLGCSHTYVATILKESKLIASMQQENRKMR